MKTKDQVRIEGKPVFYAVLYNSFRKAALDCGYALAIHGSMQSDMDLMAMPWVEDAKPVKYLILALDDCVGQTVWKDFKWKHKAKKPHGRQAYTITIMGDWHLDISVIAPKRKSKHDITILFTELKNESNERTTEEPRTNADSLSG